MPSKKQKTTRRRLYPAHRIKQLCNYDPADIAKLFGIHRNTVRHWLKGGLKAIDDRRPVLVHGTVLKAFMTERQQARRQKCQPGEFFCFRCRAPCKPWGDMADLTVRTEKIANLTALCSVCETSMHKSIRRADVPKIAKLISLQALAPERLSDCPDTSANSDFGKDRFHVETQPAK
jgi:hypothetical protein